MHGRVSDKLLELCVNALVHEERNQKYARTRAQVRHCFTMLVGACFPPKAPVKRPKSMHILTKGLLTCWFYEDANVVRPKQSERHFLNRVLQLLRRAYADGALLPIRLLEQLFTVLGLAERLDLAAEVILSIRFVWLRGRTCRCLKTVNDMVSVNAISLYVRATALPLTAS